MGTQEYTKKLSVSTEMCVNMTSVNPTISSMLIQNDTISPDTTIADNDSPTFQISYIYLSTTGLIITLLGSNLLSYICPPPPAASRRRALYSTLIWNVPFYQKYWCEKDSSEDDDMLQLTKTDEISLTKKSEPF